MASGDRGGDRGGDRRLVLVVALITFAISLLANALYGFHRDELYIVAMGRDAAWGSIDHAPLVPALSRALAIVFDESPFAQRIFAALAGSVMVALTGALVGQLGRQLGDQLGGRLGGTRRAQLLAMVAVAVAPAFVYARGVVGTNVVEQLAWTAVVYLLARTIAGSLSPRRGYLAIGVTFGVALLNKYSALGLAAALTVGLGVGLVGKRVAWSRWMVAGALVALVIWLPNLLWQHAHDYPALAFHEAHRQARAATSPLRLVFEQPAHLHPVAFALAGYGVIIASRSGSAFARTIAVASLAYVAIVVVGRGKPYYLAPLYPPLVALGALGAMQLSRMRAITIATAITAPLVLVATLPIVSWSTTALQPINRELVQFLDWRQLATAIARHYHARFPSGGGALVVGSYGTAAAIALYGPALGLPPPISGANNYAARRPPIPSSDEATRVPYRALAIGYDEALLRHFFGVVTPVGELRDPDEPARDNRFDVPRTIYLCHGMRLPLALGWSHLVRFD